MSIDSEHLGIPESNYDAKVSLPSKEYRRICGDLGTIGDTGTPAAQALVDKGYLLVEDLSQCSDYLLS